MKPSGIEWIGDIPDDWKVLKYKYAGRFEKGKLPKFINRENKGSPIIGASEMNGGLPILFTEDSDIPKCRKDDVLFLWDGANAGLVSSGLDGILSSTVVKYVCTNSINIKYLFYLTKYYEKYFKSKVNGTTIPHMSYDFISDCPLLEPPLRTQQRIADYLDEKCGEIDATIAKQKESIEKLKAYKQSLISETVTKGLDKSAPLKPSGIDYLGDIPSHWEIRKLKYVAKLDPTISEFLSDNDIVSFAPMECLGEQTLSPYETEYGKVKGKYTYFANEDIIMAKVTPCFENGNIAIARNLKNNVGFGSSELFVFRTKSVSNSFLMYALYSEPFKSLAKSTMYGTGGLKRVSPNFILNYKIPLPPLKTQESIADYLDGKCSQIDKYITEKQNIIQKLDAYKKSLIFECVTGKKRI